MWGATETTIKSYAWDLISIHAPRVGSDTSDAGMSYSLHLFQSTLPARGATVFPADVRRPPVISIHAPREGSDWPPSPSMTTSWNFNPRSPRGERPFFLLFVSRLSHFNPRSPRGERPWRLNTLPRLRLNFNPRSPRGERRQSNVHTGLFRFISIHAPREGSDYRFSVGSNSDVLFQSTLPARGATFTSFSF